MCISVYLGFTNAVISKLSIGLNTMYCVNLG